MIHSCYCARRPEIGINEPPVIVRPSTDKRAMLKPMLARLIALCVITVPVAAQVAPSSAMDPERMAALMANSQRTFKPASFVLSHKSELALTPEQVDFLEFRAKSEDDSVAARQIRMGSALSSLMKKRESASTKPATGWVGSVNEQQIRDEACEQAGISVEAVLNLMRDRQAVGAILTPTQIAQIQQLEASDMMRALKPKLP